SITRPRISIRRVPGLARASACRSLPTRNSKPRFDAPTRRLPLSMNPMPPNILTSVTALTRVSAERTARANSGSGAAELACDRGEAFGIALSLSQAQGGSRNICRLRTFAGKYALCATAQPSRRIRTTAAHAPYDQALGPRLALLCADMTRTSTLAILLAAAALAAVAAQPAEPK